MTSAATHFFSRALVLLALASSSGYAAPIPPSELASQMAAVLPRVPEFVFIQEEARKLGARAWLFGGTAASFAHYVKWDMQRNQGDDRFQSDRFDYDYTNIYRSTQDLDIVIDGSPEQAERLERALAAKYPHFLGARAGWEIRCLRHRRGTKEPLIDDFDFSHQNTDSNSVGMIELTAPPGGEARVRDLRHWKDPTNGFLDDVSRGEIHYYPSARHRETTRFRDGLNPLIFSVVRYLTKAFQYDLKVPDEDWPTIKRIIREFDPVADLRAPRARQWLEKNGKKLFQHAVDLEAAWNTLERLGLRGKLISIANDPKTFDSLAWWMSKEPLRTWKIGEFGERDGRHQLIPDLRPWKTARELGIDIVAHETQSFLAYESITRSHRGIPNTFISRADTIGESAHHGNSFYTRMGREGARGSGITIRFKMHPEAREGVDFTRTSGGDYVMILNRAALEVIPESIRMAPEDYLHILADGGEVAGQTDLALLEKFKRKTKAHLHATSPEERERMLTFFDEVMARPHAPATFVNEATELLAPYLERRQVDHLITATLPQYDALTQATILKNLRDRLTEENRIELTDPRHQRKYIGSMGPAMQELSAAQLREWMPTIRRMSQQGTLPPRLIRNPAFAALTEAGSLVRTAEKFRRSNYLQGSHAGDALSAVLDSPASGVWLARSDAAEITNDFLSSGEFLAAGEFLKIFEVPMTYPLQEALIRRLTPKAASGLLAAILDEKFGASFHTSVIGEEILDRLAADPAWYPDSMEATVLRIQMMVSISEQSGWKRKYLVDSPNPGLRAIAGLARDWKPALPETAETIAKLMISPEVGEADLPMLAPLLSSLLSDRIKYEDAIYRYGGPLDKLTPRVSKLLSLVLPRVDLRNFFWKTSRFLNFKTFLAEPENAAQVVRYLKETIAHVCRGKTEMTWIPTDYIDFVKALIANTDWLDTPRASEILEAMEEIPAVRHEASEFLKQASERRAAGERTAADCFKDRLKTAM